MSEKQNFASKLFKGLGSFFKPEVPQVIIFVTIFVFGILAYFSMSAQQTHELRVQYDIKKSKLAADDSTVSTEVVRLGETDPTVRYVERQREATSIGLGLSLFILRQKVVSSREYRDTPELMTDFAKSDILPPQTKLIPTRNAVPYGLFATTRGIYYVRYQFAPMKLEIIATGANGIKDGAVFVLRLPETAAANLPETTAANDLTNGKSNPAGKWATLFVAPSSGDAFLPPAFSDAAVYQKSGWTVEPLRAVEFSPEKTQQLQKFLENYK